MTKATSSSTDASLPLPKHALTLNYIRLRAIATLVQVPIGFIITLCHYFLHPSFLRKYEVTRSRFHVPSRQKGRTIKVDIFTPKSGVKKPYPVHINWHGSGFVLPCFGFDTELCAFLASRLGCVVLDADYRKAPQHPFPAAVQDAEDLCLYVLAHPEIYDVGKISLGGISAGAGLALAVGSKLGPEKISAICSIAPPTDFRARIHPKLAPEPGHRAALRPWATNFFAACYLVANSNRNDPLLSPICADPSSFPKSVYIATGTGDTLYEDGHGLIEMLKANNHPNAIFRAAKGEGHGFEKWKTDDPNNWATIVFDEIASVVRGSWQSQKESKL